MAFERILRLTTVIAALATSASCHYQSSSTSSICLNSTSSIPSCATPVTSTSSSPSYDASPAPSTNISSGFDYSRIANNPDKLLLSRIKVYFDAFVAGNAEALRDLEAPGYNITDLPLTFVRLPKDPWYGANKAFVSLTTATTVTAISLYGSSAPGSFAIMENAIGFTLTAEPPPGQLSAYHKGDRVGMIMLSALWWDEQGLVAHELEYGRLTWPDFDINAFYL